MADTSQFPTLDKVILAIELLKRNGFRSFEPTDNIEEYVQALSKTLTGKFNVLPNVILPRNGSDFGFKLFRARESSTFTNKDLVKEHSYCPVELTTKVNRCNFPKHPVFYCSTRPTTALIEVIKNDDYRKKKYYLSKWNIHPNNVRFLLEFFAYGVASKESSLNTLKDAAYKQLSVIFENGLTNDQEEGIKKYLEFLSDLFILDKGYSVSAALVHRRLYPPNVPNNPATDILIYPSIQTQFNGINVAIRPNFVERNVFPERFYEVEIESFNRKDGLINIVITKYGLTEGTQIEWVNVEPFDSKYQEYFRRDFEFNDEFRFTRSGAAP